jgi:hypothetical protein
MRAPSRTGKESTTFNVEEWYHVAEFLDMLRKMLLARNVFQPLQSLLREPGSDASKLMDGTEIREALAREPETRNGLGLVPLWWWSEFEALLGEICSAIETNQFFWVGLDVVEYFAKEFVG